MAKATLPAATLAGAAYERLRADLLACRLPPGAPIKINELSTTLATNPIAIREALSRLTAEGLVVAEPQKGFRAAPISPEDLRDLTWVRIEIEGLCLKSAMAHGGMEWETNIVAALHRLQRTNLRDEDDAGLISDGWVCAHMQFHAALTRGCPNQLLRDIRAQLYARAERYLKLSVPLDDRNRDLIHEHSELAALVLARDEAGALKAMADHLQTTTDILLHTPFLAA